jgi:hypothetical protein
LSLPHFGRQWIEINLAKLINSRNISSLLGQEFKDSEEDSIVTIEFLEALQGTLIKITHENLPPHGQQYEEGWKKHYFNPMKDHFEG